MKMILFLLPVLASLAAAQASGLDVSLAVAARQNPREAPYRRAVLTVLNDTPRDFHAVRLRWRHGGPTMIFPAYIPSSSENRCEIDVLIPAVSPVETFDVHLLSEDRRVSSAVKTTAEITWPVELLSAEAFIDPAAYRPFEGALPAWSPGMKKAVFLAAVLYCLALAAVLLLRRPAARTGVLVAVVLLATTGAMYLVIKPAGDKPLEMTVENALLVVRARRTTRADWPSGPAGGACFNVPVYHSPQQLAGDNLTIHATRGASVKIRPDEIRLFRKCGSEEIKP